MNIKENERLENTQVLRKTKKPMENEGDLDTNCCWCP